MIYRVSFYRKAEVVAGRAPRYMKDVDATDLEEAKNIVLAEDGVIVRSAYKAPEAPIRSKPSFVFETAAARNKWYSSHKSTQKERLCHECKTNEVEHYKRICTECRAKRESVTDKPCIECKTNIPSSSRKRYCDTCAAKRKEQQEKFHREKRAKQTTMERIKTQVAWAQEQLKTVTLPACKLSSRFQGLRLPHVNQFPFTASVEDKPAPKNRCRACLQKFIDVQTVYLANLIAATPEPSDINQMLTEIEHVHAHSATAGA